MVKIEIDVTIDQSTAFQEAVAYWNLKNDQTLTAKEMIKRLARQFYRDNVFAKRNESDQANTETELDNTWS